MQILIIIKYFIINILNTLKYDRIYIYIYIYIYILYDNLKCIIVQIND